MKVFVIGSRGQLGRTLEDTAPDCVELAGDDLPQLDITNAVEIESRLAAERPEFVINAAAYTSVDRAEIECELARQVNCTGAGNGALAAAKVGARFLHISTDYVFDGTKGSPYAPYDATAPLGVYGRTKLEGEGTVADRTNGDAVIVRTAWLYSKYGKNFVKTMLQLMRERDEIAVVTDQFGNPTWSCTLADTIWMVIEKNLAGGIYHWTDSGETNWHGFASAIYQLGTEIGICDREVKINPIKTADYPTPAQRPAYSALDCSATCASLGVEQTPWQTSLLRMLTEMRAE